METKDKITFTTKDGNKIEVADSIIAAAVVEAIFEIKGIAGFKDGKFDEISKRLARGKTVKSIVITPKEDEEIDIDLYLTVQFRASIPTISDVVKERVEENVKAITGINVSDVVVHVSGIDVIKS
ncbi:Asp23/Gls24 family envelope stress response protein [Candidatus Oleimmundimicrobium sp.]|uniref:Asp23/Gls24 family envelope stress response protein n=1 Tax=Candidatus Oleimmundimicrobium sp. TaxID=3060597 RepID=UPI00272350C2|nr:Asp23/Gls24 family envelope stress response protein [Candidatus Oleimmundimicrobium sp.]MDO8886851.1 Asp23/Gls24 family envelope stress response protein [Candidatus Oleimmundimicrobium sp.]